MEHFLGRRVALVGPSFSYLDAISIELNRRGVFSVHLDERHSNRIIAKIKYRIGFYNTFKGAKKRHLKALYNQIIDKNISDVLLVDVEVCDRDFVEKLIKANINVGIYMWDSAKNKPNFLKYIDLLTAKSSFDPLDCETFGLRYIPLFAEFGNVNKCDIQIKKSDIYFCGTLHSNRPKIINQVLKFSKINKLNFISHNYYHSRLLFLIKSLVSPSYLSIFKTVTSKSIPKSEIYNSMATSKYVLDIQHEGQKGLTARTFEALRAGAHLITTNDFAKNLPLGLSRRVKVFSCLADLESINFSELAGEGLTPDQDYYLSIQRFADDVISLMNLK